MQFKLDPIKRFALFLVIFAGAAAAVNFSEDVMLHLAATLGFGLLLYIFYSWASSKHKNVWDTLITSLILFLVLHYGVGLTSLAAPLLATFFAMTLKFFIEYKGSPIVNPAAFGILITAGIFALAGQDLPFASWWGASFSGALSLVLIAIWVIGGFYVWRKFPLFFAFLLVHAVLFYAQNQDLDSLRFVFTDSTIYFFAAVMLAEPKTSPLKPGKEVAYGALVAVLYNALLYWGVPYYELFALVGGNLFNAGLRWHHGRNIDKK